YELHYQNISSILGVQFQPKDYWKIGLNLSRAWRAPQANELFSNGFHLESARMEIGNKNLKPEAAWSANVYTQSVFFNRLNINLNAYRQSLSNFVYLEPGSDVLTIRGYYKRFFYRQTDASFSGTDVTLTYQ